MTIIDTVFPETSVFFAHVGLYILRKSPTTKWVNFSLRTFIFRQIWQFSAATQHFGKLPGVYAVALTSCRESSLSEISGSP